MTSILSQLIGCGWNVFILKVFWLWLLFLKVQSATAQLNTSQSAIINASHSIRLILDDLKAVSEKIDIITSCQILPDININNPNNCTAPAPWRIKSIFMCKISSWEYFPWISESRRKSMLALLQCLRTAPMHMNKYVYWTVTHYLSVRFLCPCAWSSGDISVRSRS